MQKLLFIFCLSFLCFSEPIIALNRPSILLVPSDDYCKAKGFLLAQTNNGKTTNVPDYMGLMQNDVDFNNAIVKIGTQMNDYGYPVKDLLSELKRSELELTSMQVMNGPNNKSIQLSPLDIINRSARADIIVELYFDFDKVGVDKFCQFRIKGIDAYSNKNIASAIGNSSANPYATNDELMFSAVMTELENFLSQLNGHFQRIQENGKEIRITCLLEDDNNLYFDSEVEIQGSNTQLGYVIEDLIEKGTMPGNSISSSGDEKILRFDQVIIPYLDINQKPNDAKKFCRNFTTELKNQTPINVRIIEKGIGEVVLIFGNKKTE